MNERTNELVNCNEIKEKIETLVHLKASPTSIRISMFALDLCVLMCTPMRQLSVGRTPTGFDRVRSALAHYGPC